MKKIFFGALALSVVLYGKNIELVGELKISQEQGIGKQDIEEQNGMNQPVNVEKQENMRQWINKVRRKYKKPDNEIFSATEPVKAYEDDPKFIEYVNNAFDRAFLQVRAEQILNKAAEISSSELFDSFNTNANDQIKEESLKIQAVDGLNQQKAISKQQLDYAREQMRARLKNQGLKFDSIGEFLESFFKEATDAEVDAALAKQGVTNIQKLSRQEKQNTFKQNYAKNLAKRGSGEIVGLIPIQTKLIRNSKGAWELGLVAIISPKTAQVAMDLKNKVKTRIKKDGECKTLEEQIPIDDLSIIYEMIGPRLYYMNKECEPVIVSFGRAGVLLENNEIRNKSLISVAEKRANLYASGYLSNFITSKIDTITKDQKEEIDMTNAILNAKITVNLDDNQIIRKEDIENTGIENENIKDSVYFFSQRIKADSSERLNGEAPFGSWDTIDIDETEKAKYHPAVGAIRYYSTSMILNSKEFHENLKKPQKISEIKQNSANKSTRKTIESYNNNNPDDF